MRIILSLLAFTTVVFASGCLTEALHESLTDAMRNADGARNQTGGVQGQYLGTIVAKGESYHHYQFAGAVLNEADGIDVLIPFYAPTSQTPVFVIPRKLPVGKGEPAELRIWAGTPDQLRQRPRSIDLIRFNSTCSKEAAQVRYSHYGQAAMEAEGDALIILAGGPRTGRKALLVCLGLVGYPVAVAVDTCIGVCFGFCVIAIECPELLELIVAIAAGQ